MAASDNIERNEVTVPEEETLTDLPPARGVVMPPDDDVTRNLDVFRHNPEEEDAPEDWEDFEEEEGDAVTRTPLPQVTWPQTDAEAPDYAHLEPEGREPKLGDPKFSFGRRELDLLAKANQYVPEGYGDHIVFAIRGARLSAGREEEAVQAIGLEETRPDHRNFQCTLGIFDRNTGKLSAFEGSTVPNVKNMTNYYKWQNKIGHYRKMGANMLPTGCYVYRKNAHSRGRIRPALRMTNPDRLSQDGSVTTLRTHNDLTFTTVDYWDKCKPYDNVHCAYSNNKFSSAGCLTIRGPNKSGQWGKFQAILDPMPWDARLDVFLFTGREASIAAYIIAADKQDDEEFVRRYLGRLRHGSQGPAVKRLQEKLGGTATGYFGPTTKKLLVDCQAQNNLRVDGIYTPALDGQLGWDVMEAWSLTGEEPPKPNAGIPGVPPVAQPEPVPQPMPVVVPAGPGAAGATAPSPSVITRPRMVITEEKLRRFAPSAKQQYIDAFLQHADLLTEFGIDQTPERFCHFLGQIGNESGRLRILEENMNYTTPRRLQVVWPKRFPTRDSALPYVRNPEALANSVYGGRLGNTQPGDGWTYRGRGLVQTTGRGGYRRLGKKLNIGLEENPDLACDARHALRIACETWASKTLDGERSMNALADINKLEAMTYRINGGYTNIDDRRAAFEEAWAIWADGSPPKTVAQEGVLDRGDRGSEVQILNNQLASLGMFDGITRRKPTRVFGYSTYKAVRAFHKSAGGEQLGYVSDETVEALDEALNRRTRSVRRSPSPETLPHSEDTVSDRIKSRLRWIRTTAVVLALLAVAYGLIRLYAAELPGQLSQLIPLAPFIFAGIILIISMVFWIASAPLSVAARGPIRRRASNDDDDEDQDLTEIEQEPVRSGINLDVT